MLLDRDSLYSSFALKVDTNNRPAPAVAAETVARLSKTEWGQSTASDLRRFLVQQIESHVERRLITAPLLEKLEVSEALET